MPCEYEAFYLLLFGLVSSLRPLHGKDSKRDAACLGGESALAWFAAGFMLFQT
jgi:hypothetical protein